MCRTNTVGVVHFLVSFFASSFLMNPFPAWIMHPISCVRWPFIIYTINRGLFNFGDHAAVREVCAKRGPKLLYTHQTLPVCSPFYRTLAKVCGCNGNASQLPLDISVVRVRFSILFVCYALDRNERCCLVHTHTHTHTQVLPRNFTKKVPTNTSTLSNCAISFILFWHFMQTQYFLSSLSPLGVCVCVVLYWVFNVVIVTHVFLSVSLSFSLSLSLCLARSIVDGSN